MFEWVMGWPVSKAPLFPSWLQEPTWRLDREVLWSPPWQVGRAAAALVQGRSHVDVGCSLLHAASGP